MGFWDSPLQWEIGQNLYNGEATKHLKLCPACKEIAPANRKCCPNCGAVLPAQTLHEQMTAGKPHCPACGTAVAESTRFCPECGTQIRIKGIGNKNKIL